MSITIKPVRFTENGFMTQPFALGGEGAEELDPAVKYRSCLQNWVIDTGSEVILVDTGLPSFRPVRLCSRHRPASTSAPSAAMSMTPPNMTASRSRICPPTGAVRAASSQRRNSTAHDGRRILATFLLIPHVAQQEARPAARCRTCL